jgi:hypothetical protein
MKAIIIAAVAFLIAGVAAGAEPGPELEGKGSCYEVKPICIQGAPVCMCTITLDCYWACR